MGFESRRIKLETKVSTFVLSADDSLLAVGLANTIQIYGVTSLELRQVLDDHIGTFEKMSFAPKKRSAHTLVSYSENWGEDGSIIWWDLDNDGKSIHTSPTVDVVEGIRLCIRDAPLVSWL